MSAHALAQVATSESASAAATALGISRETIYEWIRSKKIARPKTWPPARQHKASLGTKTPWKGSRHKTFLGWILATYTLSRAEQEVAKLAQKALDIANDPGTSQSDDDEENEARTQTL